MKNIKTNTEITNVNNNTNKEETTMKNTRTNNISRSVKITRKMAAMLAAVMAATTMASIGASAADTKNAVINMNTQNAATAIAADNFIQKPEFKSFGSGFNSIAKDFAGVGADAAIKAVAGDGITGALLSKGAEYILGMIFEDEAEPTIADVLNKLDELSDKIDNYHDEEMTQLKAINSNIDSKDFRMEADSIKDDYRAVIKKIQQYAANITTPGEGVIDNTTYKAYKEILAQPTCNLSTLEKNFDIMVDYVKGNRSSSDHTSGYALTSKYLMDKILANYKETQHDWKSSPDFLEYLDKINKEIELMESNVVMDYITILSVNNMAYKVREYEVENGIYTVNENEQPYYTYEKFATDLTESLKSIDGIYKQVIEDNNNNGEFVQATAEIADPVGGKKVKGFHSFSEAWAQTYKTGSKNYSLQLRTDIKADNKKGFNFDNLSSSTYEFRNNGGFHINEGRTVTIDLGGHTIDCSNKKDIKLFAMHNNTNLTVSNGTILGCRNTFHSRDRDNVNLTLKNLTVKDSKESVIYFDTPSQAKCSLTMDGCRIENCDKVFVRSEKAKINVKNSEFLNNKSSGKGGAILAHSYEYLYFENCTFRGNKASDYGGAICANSVECRNCTFDNNEGSYGGALYVDFVKLYNNTFKNNYSRNDGGALYSNNGTENERIEGNTFENNRARVNGGAIFIYTIGKYIKNNTFVNNEASYASALIYYVSKGVTADQIRNSMGNTGL